MWAGELILTLSLSLRKCSGKLNDCPISYSHKVVGPGRGHSPTVQVHKYVTMFKANVIQYVKIKTVMGGAGTTYSRPVKFVQTRDLGY